MSGRTYASPAAMRAALEQRLLIADYGIQYRTLARAYQALTAFWQPVIEETRSGAVWDAENWIWS